MDLFSSLANIESKYNIVLYEGKTLSKLYITEK